MTKDTKLILTYGTPYHTGDQEDYENKIADDLNAEKIGGQEWVETEKVVFDFKHFIGSSQVPHGRHTASAREALWSELWAQRGLAPRSDVIIRSHVHYHQYCGDALSLRMTTPCLQTLGSKFGSRKCSGLVDYGFLVFEVTRGKVEWDPILASLKGHVAQSVKL
jgi:hypothetical protein